MNDEIKEKMTIGKAKKILRGFLAKDCYYDTLLYYAIPYLLDYITNLQQELEDYKSRCEKAVEYIKADYINGLVDGLSWLETQKLVKILNGMSDE